jgi:Delta14-sterol reductase
MWLLFNIAFLVKQYDHYGFVTDSMWLVALFQGFYTVDALWYEEAFFSTMDVATDGSGFMLDMGNLLWVPFFYSLQARFLASHPVVLGPIAIAGVLTLKVIGYYIFRSANLQKDRFKADHESVKGFGSLRALGLTYRS